ncbi:glycosyltransferase family 1 protein [Bacteroides congonensis]
MEIRSERKWQGVYYNQLVYEWEDICCERMPMTLKYKSRNLYTRVKDKLGRIFHIRHLFRKDYELQFVIKTGKFYNLDNISKVIPWIVDFYYSKEELPAFYHYYSHCRLLLISSREAYEFLKNNGCPLNIRHLALSLPDQYRIEHDVLDNKKYDMILMGRQNAVLYDWMKRYAERHPDFTYVERKDMVDFEYVASTGESVGICKGHEDMIRLLEMCRVGMYSTPSMDVESNRTRGLNQVTPRFLEYIACGCHVAMRYPLNPDTDYYELPKFGPSIESYEMFENYMDNARHTLPDMEMYTAYLEKHYTSRRVDELREILIENNIK